MSSLPPQARQPVFNVPAPVIWLLAGLALAHFARATRTDSEDLLFQYGFVPARYASEFLTANHIAPESLWDRVVPFFSSMALHGDFMHLGINLLWLLAFAPAVARRFGSLRFFMFFIVCGVAGTLAHLYTNWASPIPVVGASAAISGLMAAAMRIMPAHGPFGHVPANDLPLVPMSSPRLLMFSVVWMVINALMGITGLGGSLDGEVRLIAWEAHMGGYIAGYVLAGPFDRWAPTGRYAT